MVSEHEEQENEINPDINKPSASPGEEYMQISTFAPAKTVELPTEKGAEGAKDGPRSLTDAMDDATDLTDMQFAFKNMFMGDEHSKRRQFARVAPEAFLSMLQFGLTSKIMTTSPEKPIDVSKELDILYADYTIGLDGEGRIDAGKLLGAAREIKKEESLIKGL